MGGGPPGTPPAAPPPDRGLFSAVAAGLQQRLAAGARGRAGKTGAGIGVRWAPTAIAAGDEGQRRGAWLTVSSTQDEAAAPGGRTLRRDPGRGAPRAGPAQGERWAPPGRTSSGRFTLSPVTFIWDPSHLHNPACIPANSPQAPPTLRSPCWSPKPHPILLDPKLWLPECKLGHPLFVTPRWPPEADLSPRSTPVARLSLLCIHQSPHRVCSGLLCPSLRGSQGPASPSRFA